MLNSESVTGILITLDFAETQTLYLMLDANGTIHRMGDGGVLNAELDLFVGVSLGVPDQIVVEFVAELAL